MMKLLYSRARKTKNPDDETRAMINTYGKTVSFINFDSLNKIELEYMENGRFLLLFKKVRNFLLNYCHGN